MELKQVVVLNDIADLGVSYYRPFESIGPLGHQELIFTNPQNVACLVLTGGADVHPSFYQRSVNRKTFSDIDRDKEEKIFFEAAVKHNIPIIGICRGAQLVCALSGGILIQHVKNHHSSHPIKTSENESVSVNSIHHQMQFPPPNAKILAWADPRKSDKYEGEDEEELYPDFECEAVYYPETNALGIQWHPETMPKDSAGYKYAQKLITSVI